MTTSTPSKECAFVATVASRRMLCREHVEIDLAAPSFPRSEPGQFLQLLCADEPDATPHELEWREGAFPLISHRDQWGTRETYLRRPFSIADHYTDSAGVPHLRVISRAIGPGTRWLEKLCAGDSLDITGPLGRPFVIPQDERPLVLIGGGVGIPPMLYLARRLHDLRKTDVTIIVGSMSRDLLPVDRYAEPSTSGTALNCLVLPADAAFPAIVTTDDGSLGLRGRTTDGLRAWKHARDPSFIQPPLVFACGPEGMLQAIAALTRELALDCQLCIERHMGCGLGTCLSCVVRVNSDKHPAGWRWALTCTEGPVFPRDVLWSPAVTP
jgi:dihydroorotate dehydrogenase electron transfer subunit